MPELTSVFPAIDPASRHWRQRIREIEPQLGFIVDGLFNVAGRILSLTIGFFLVPIMLGRLGPGSYGLWLITQTVAAAVATFTDCGLHLAVIREIGADGDSGGASTARFVTAAATFYVLLAIAGALLIVAVAIPLLSLLKVPVHERQSVFKVFCVVGIGFVADQFSSFQRSVLQGLRKFDLSNALLVSDVLVSAVAVVAMLAFNSQLLGVVEAQTAVAFVFAAASYLTTRSLQPRLIQIPTIDWKPLRSRMRFGLLSYLATLMNTALWEGPALLVGLMLGPARLVPYYLGCKFPLTISTFTWELAAVMIPVASQSERAGNVAVAQTMLAEGTRWIMIATLPLYLLLWIEGPNLLQAWMAHVPPESISILRLMTVATAISTVDGSACTLLLGRGQAGVLLALTSVEVAMVAGLGGCLLGRIGVQGVSWAMALVIPSGALVVLSAAAASCESTLLHIVQRVARGLWVPLLSSAVATSLVLRLFSPTGWLSLISTGSVGAIVYFGFLGLSTRRWRSWVSAGT